MVSVILTPNEYRTSGCREVRSQKLDCSRSQNRLPLCTLLRFGSAPVGQGTLATSWPTAVKLLKRYHRYILDNLAVALQYGTIGQR